MAEQETFNIGESVVNRTNFKMGTVSDTKESLIEVSYGDGSREWISEGQITRLLLES